MDTFNHILRAVAHFENPSRLAAAIGYSQHAVWHAIHVRKQVSPQMAVAIHKATKGQVRKDQLRPDLFEAPAQ